MIWLRFLIIKSSRRISGSTFCGYQWTLNKVKSLSLIPVECIFCSAVFKFTRNLMWQFIIHYRIWIYHTPWYFEIISPYFWQVIFDISANIINPVQRAACPLPDPWESFQEGFRRMKSTQEIVSIDNTHRNIIAA